MSEQQISPLIMIDDLIVAKFGGWSVQTPENTDKSIDIILQDDRRKFIVVSGPKGSTNLYLKAAKEVILSGSVSEDTYRKISDIWKNLCYKLDVQENLDKINEHFLALLDYTGPRDIESEPAKRFIDNIARLGEFYEAKYIFVPRFNKRVGAEKAVFLDPADVLIGTDTPGDASILPESEDKLRNAVSGLIDSHVVVMPGFYCSTKDGDIVTLPRSGSDTSGSFAAKSLNALLYENYSNDVIRRASPDAVPNALSLEKITYDEALELAYMGFGIFKDQAVVPCKDKLIPIHVIDTLNPERWTEILAHRQYDGHVVTGISYKSGFGSVDIKKVLRTREEDPSLTPYVLHTELGVGGQGEFPIEQIMTSVAKVSFLIPGEKFTDENAHRVKRHLMEYFKLPESDIGVSYNISLLSVVGQYNIKDEPGINARAAGSLAIQGISTSHILQGGSPQNILYGVQETTPEPLKARAGVRAIYNEFFIDSVFGRFIEQQRKFH